MAHRQHGTTVRRDAHHNMVAEQCVDTTTKSTATRTTVTNSYQSVVATFRVARVLTSSLSKRDGNDVQDGTTRDRSLVADDANGIKCNLTHDQDNLDGWVPRQSAVHSS